MDALFAYGTLLYAEVLRAVTGAAPPAVPAVLEGFVRRCVAGEVFPAVVELQGSRVEGLLYAPLAPGAWRRLDRFEGDLYARRTVRVRLDAPGPGAAMVAAETYVLRPEHRQRLGAAAWEPETFARDPLAAYLERIV